MALFIFPYLSYGLARCSITVNRDLTFVDYNPISAANSTSTGEIKVRCTGSGSASYELQLSSGQVGSYMPRAMALVGGGSSLNYNIYIDAAYSSIWGDGTGSTSTVSQSGSTPLTNLHTAYGLIPGSQTTAKIGSYSDTIINPIPEITPSVAFFSCPSLNSSGNIS